jgi:hypothetical protein
LLAVVILRRWLIRPLLILVRPLLLLVRSLILVRPLLILIWPLLLLVRSLVLIRPLLIPILALILRSVLPSLHLRVSELAPRSAALKTALAGCGHHGETKERAKEQDRRGNRRRTHSFRVGIPVHKTFSELAPIWRLRRVAPGKRPKFEKVILRSGCR